MCGLEEIGTEMGVDKGARFRRFQRFRRFHRLKGKGESPAQAKGRLELADRRSLSSALSPMWRFCFGLACV
jgi:hypothetical protein